MAQDVGPSESVAAEAPRSMTPPATIESRADRARRGAYRYRFAAIYFFLAALVGGAVGATLVLAARDAPTPTRWSSFQPDGSSLAKVRQIADVVSSQYRANGKQLVFAVAGPPQLITQDGEIGVTAIAVAPDTSRGKREEGDYDVFDAESSVAYRLCGSRDNCSVSLGTPSTGEYNLYRREALELALYTFRYLKDTDSVVVSLPPRPAVGDRVSADTVLLRRSDVESELDSPLITTLPTAPPLSVGSPSPDDQANVDRLTLPHLYVSTPRAVPDGVFLVLTPSAAA